ncbi:hypothetical protein K488DRAFT_72595 [Vararia minispora EC-137]|uniref:Uncharacterized protein n=1 Tax=Vararia minispora EC-137 TaxID=1314806 RepID=A0ACB8QDX8_9AGAM|nr:hypothetical protein K488DRAFT_72595 [Vararia minispora EC-137]
MCLLHGFRAPNPYNAEVIQEGIVVRRLDIVIFPVAHCITLDIRIRPTVVEVNKFAMPYTLRIPDDDVQIYVGESIVRTQPLQLPHHDHPGPSEHPTSEEQQQRQRMSTFSEDPVNAHRSSGIVSCQSHVCYHDELSLALRGVHSIREHLRVEWDLLCCKLLFCARRSCHLFKDLRPDEVQREFCLASHNRGTKQPELSLAATCAHWPAFPAAVGPASGTDVNGCDCYQLRKGLLLCLSLVEPSFAPHGTLLCADGGSDALSARAAP